MLSFECLSGAPGTSLDVLLWGREGQQRAKDQRKDYEVGANCTVLLILLRLCDGGVCMQFSWPQCLLFL